MKPEKSSNFDPHKMRALAKKMITDGTMPPPDQFLAAIERIRAECAEKILKAREQDQMENLGPLSSPENSSRESGKIDKNKVKTKSKKKPVHRV